MGELIMMKIKNDSLAVVGKEMFEENTKYFLRYTLNMVDYNGIWLWDFNDHMTINVTSAVDGAVYFKKVHTYEEAEQFVQHVFKKLDKLDK